MSDAGPLRFMEEAVPLAGIEDSIAEIVELYGGETVAAREGERVFILPLRRGVSAGGGVECTLTWTGGTEPLATLTLRCDRDVDGPRWQRIPLLVTGVAGAVLFMIWPFFPGNRQIEVLAWIGGAIAIAVYLLSIRRSSGGIAHDFLQRLVRRQREND